MSLRHPSNVPYILPTHNARCAASHRIRGDYRTRPLPPLPSLGTNNLQSAFAAYISDTFQQTPRYPHQQTAGYAGIQIPPSQSSSLSTPKTPGVPNARRSYLRSFPNPSHISATGSLWTRSWILKAREFIIRYFVEWWVLEIISWCFSAACMATVIGVLLSYQGRPIPNWPMGLTLNSFISVLSGFARSTLLLPTAEALGQLKWNWFRGGAREMMDFERLDMASRGPWGALVFLARTKRL